MQRWQADAARLGSDGVARERLDQAMLLARGGIDLHESVATRSSLLSVVMRSPAVLKVPPTNGWPQFSVAVSPDGSLAAVGSERGTVMIFDARSGRPRGTYETDNLVQDLAFSPDGATLAATVDRPPGALLDIVDVNTRKRLRRVELPAPEREAELVVAVPRFAPDGNLVVIQAALPPEQPSVVRRYDPRTGKVLGRPLALGAFVNTLTATADGRRLVGASEADDETYVIDPVRLRLVSRHKGGGSAAGVSADGRTVALGSGEGELRLLDLRSGRARPLEGTHEGGIIRAAFAQDGRTVVTTGSDGKLNVWDAEAGLRETLSGHDRNDTYGLAVGPDGRTVYTRGERRSRARVGRLGRAAPRHPVLRRRADLRRLRPIPPRSRVRSGGPDVRADAGRRQRPVRRCAHAAGRGKPPRARRHRARSRRQPRRPARSRFRARTGRSRSSIARRSDASRTCAG